MKLRPLGIGLVMLSLAACATGGLNRSPDGVFAPGVARGESADGLIVGHRLMAAGEYELALKAYNRAAAQQGLNVDTMSAIGSANLNLGRLGQAERWLRRAVEEDPTFPPAWNNLGVILMERGNVSEASEVFRRAFAADNGNSDEIRDNLRLALAKLENPINTEEQEYQNFNLIRRGAGDFVLMSEPL
ncbi:tetratricopeptide repeat protein [Loktanella sp. PT4BL]|jgi:Flp pilus assembly protein TadD|uniref:tetratricopeptide repeat protein n=1 Tax=Loktanella sp. PT4BL TaxID=2135611 RepID=UPI000D7609E5|nr:tetratricopeptide repeat protein [Loktanella sp. PT4BL]PXW72629.1 tetratricopeptide repeat protein [Loktanella sp. PT4BL]